MIPDGLADIPRTWWGREGPVTDRELIRLNGNRQRVRVSGVAPFQTHCLANVGLTTDLQGDVVVRPHTYPVPYAGLTVTTRGVLEPVEEVAAGALEFQAVSSLLPGVFAELEEPTWNTVPEGRRPSLKGSLPAPVLRALYRSTIGDGRELFSFHATHVLPTFPSPNAGIVAPMTVVKGWLARSAGSGFAVERMTAIPTDLDEKGSTMLKPFGRLSIGGRQLWLGTLNGYEWETYVVFEMDKVLLEANAGGC